MTGTTSTAAPLQTVRGTVAGLACGLGAVTAHTATGHLPSAGVTAATFAVTALGCTALARRRLGFRTLLAMALAGQAAAHLLLSSGGGPHQHQTGSAVHSLGGLGGLVGSSGGTALAAHLVVAAVVALVGSRADAAVLSVARDLLARVLPPAHRAPAALGRPTLPAWGAVQPLAARLHLLATPRRGPPVGVLPSPVPT